MSGIEDSPFNAEALMAKAEELGQTWMKGVAGDLAKKILRERPT